MKDLSDLSFKNVQINSTLSFLNSQHLSLEMFPLSKPMPKIFVWISPNYHFGKKSASVMSLYLSEIALQQNFLQFSTKLFKMLPAKNIMNNILHAWRTNIFSKLPRYGMCNIIIGLGERTEIFRCSHSDLKNCFQQIH